MAEGKRRRDLAALRRWKRETKNLLREIASVLYYADPEGEQPIVKRVERQIRRRLGG